MEKVKGDTMHRKHVDLIKLWADDSELEVQYLGYGDSDNVHWCDIDDPAWDDRLHYRFKPPNIEIGKSYNLTMEDDYGRPANVILRVLNIDCNHAMVVGVDMNHNQKIAIPFKQFKSKKANMQNER